MPQVEFLDAATCAAGARGLGARVAVDPGAAGDARPDISGQAPEGDDTSDAP